MWQNDYFSLGHHLFLPVSWYMILVHVGICYFPPGILLSPLTSCMHCQSIRTQWQMNWYLVCLYYWRHKNQDQSFILQRLMHKHKQDNKLNIVAFIAIVCWYVRKNQRSLLLQYHFCFWSTKLLIYPVNLCFNMSSGQAWVPVCVGTQRIDMVRRNHLLPFYTMTDQSMWLLGGVWLPYIKSYIWCGDRNQITTWEGGGYKIKILSFLIPIW